MSIRWMSLVNFPNLEVVVFDSFVWFYSWLQGRGFAYLLTQPFEKPNLKSKFCFWPEITVIFHFDMKKEKIWMMRYITFLIKRFNIKKNHINPVQFQLENQWDSWQNSIRQGGYWHTDKPMYRLEGPQTDYERQNSKNCSQ